MAEPKFKLVFAEGCFDDFNGTEEELAAMLADLHQMAQDDTLIDNATPLSEQEEQEFIEMMQKRLPRQ